jgi:hypothetical protein
MFIEAASPPTHTLPTTSWGREVPGAGAFREARRSKGASREGLASLGMTRRSARGCAKGARHAAATRASSRKGSRRGLPLFGTTRRWFAGTGVQKLRSASRGSDATTTSSPS